MRIFDSIEANAYKYHYQNMLNMEIITGANVNLHPRPQNRLIWFAFVWDVVHSENGSQSNGFELCCWSFEVGWIHWKPICWYANQFVVNIYIWCSGNWQSIISRNWTLQAKADLNAWSLFAEVMNFRFRYSKHKTFWCIRNWHCEATRANYNFCSVWKTMKSNKQKIKLQIHPLCRHYGNARFFHHHQQ